MSAPPPAERGEAGAATVDFYFDFASPYAYFAQGRLAALAQRHGLHLRYRPILLWAVMKELGLPPPLAQADKRRYLEFDMHRCAAYYGLPLRFPPGFPAPGLAAARLFHALAAMPAAGQEGLDAALTAALFHAEFAEGRDLSDQDTLVEIAGSVGVEPQRALQAVSAEAGKSALREATAEAAQRGVCGSPFWFWQGEPYFGADRLPQFEHRLGQGTAPAV